MMMSDDIVEMLADSIAGYIVILCKIDSGKNRSYIKDKAIQRIKQALSEDEPIIRKDEREATADWLDNKIIELKAVKDKHKKSNSCEYPHTCGGCHFYTGSIEFAIDLAKQLRGKQ